MLGAPEVELAKLRVLEHFFQHGHISTLRPPGEVFVVGVFGFPQLNEDDLGRVLPPYLAPYAGSGSPDNCGCRAGFL